MSNILSMSKMAKQFSITYDIWVINAFEVHKLDGAVRSFVVSSCGLIYMDINNYHVDSALVTTVADKNRITLLRTILLLNVPELSKIILVDLAWLNSSKLLKIICWLTALVVRMTSRFLKTYGDLTWVPLKVKQ